MDQSQETGGQSGGLTRRYRVSGRVQGVGFRYFVLRQAQGIGIRGWVRNLYSGEVEVQATGSAEQLAAIERALWKGPRFSSVANVEISEREGEGVGVGFEIID